MSQNFTFADIMGSLQSVVLLPLFIVLPGYVAGWGLNLFSFRQRRMLTRLLLSTPLSIAVCPVFTFLAGTAFGFPGIWTLYGSIWAMFVLILALERPRLVLRPVSRLEWGGVGILVAWILLALGTVVDLQLSGHRLYFSTTAYDYSLRAALTSAITRGFPPVNPFFAVDPVPLRYHYFWMLICSLPSKLTGIVPRQALYSGTIWMGIALMSLVAVAVRLSLKESNAVGRKAVLALALLAVTGLDLIPTLYNLLLGKPVRPDMEWWNWVQITSWADSLLWVPHHVGGLIASMIGLLLLLEASEATSRKQQIAAVLVAGAAFASSVGMSVFVTLTMVIFFLLWVVVNAVQRRGKDILLAVTAGAVALALVLPYLKFLSGPGGGGKFLEITVRQFSPLDELLFRAGVRDLWKYRVVDFLTLPLNYFLELGFFFVVGILQWRRCRFQHHASIFGNAPWTLLATSFLMGSFLKSSTIASNDLGWRCFLPAQFVLLMWAIPMLDDWLCNKRFFRWRSAGVVFVAALLGLGVTGTAYQIAMLRLYPILRDRGTVPDPGWLSSDHELGRRTFSQRRAYEMLQARLPVEAIVQSNPGAKGYLPSMLYPNRASAAINPTCGTAFGGDLMACYPVSIMLQRLFRQPAKLEGSQPEEVCHRFKIDALLVTDMDLAWKTQESWVWSRTPLLADEYVRVFSCGGDRLAGKAPSPAVTTGSSPPR